MSVRVWAMALPDTTVSLRTMSEIYERDGLLGRLTQWARDIRRDYDRDRVVFEQNDIHRLAEYLHTDSISLFYLLRDFEPLM